MQYCRLIQAYRLTQCIVHHAYNCTLSRSRISWDFLFWRLLFGGHSRLVALPHENFKPFIFFPKRKRISIQIKTPSSGHRQIHTSLINLSEQKWSYHNWIEINSTTLCQFGEQANTFSLQAGKLELKFGPRGSNLYCLKYIKTTKKQPILPCRLTGSLDKPVFTLLNGSYE